jgi:1-deoxy-D-xylulose-5-phosphate synthase
VLQLGLRDQFIEHGDPAKLLSMQGLDAAGIERSVRERFGDLLQRPDASLKVVA